MSAFQNRGKEKETITNRNTFKWQSQDPNEYNKVVNSKWLKARISSTPSCGDQFQSKGKALTKNVPLHSNKKTVETIWQRDRSQSCTTN